MSETLLNGALICVAVVPIGLATCAFYFSRSRSHFTETADQRLKYERGLILLLWQCLIPGLQLPVALHRVNNPWPAGVSQEVLISWAYFTVATSVLLYASSSWQLIRVGKVFLPVLGFVDLLLSFFLFLCNFAPTP